MTIVRSIPLTYLAILAGWTWLYPTHLYAQAAAQPTPSTLEMMVIPVGFLILMYVVFIRPGAKKFKEQKEFLDALKPQDEVLTTGGILGRVTRIQHDTVHLDVGCGIIKILKQNLQPKPAESAVKPAKLSATL